MPWDFCLGGCMLESWRWKEYDPTWLVALAREQLPEEVWLPEALAKCTRCVHESVAYIYFVDGPTNANQPGSEWQFEINMELHSPTEGWIVLDILKGQRVGGVEFVSKIQEIR